MKEPIKNKKIWLGFLVIFIMLNPWYFPSGGEPVLIYGVPLWAIVIIIMSIVLSLYITYVIHYHWDTLDEEENGEEK
ncbi:MULTISPECIES: hypothetical protein [Salinicoccus]|uniref:DUF3311 domain-containing protein n=2 Tax=Salinicoccus TaxID=45669 RepID=A0A285UJX6_9STAP|nr:MULTISPECIES: hypothetical protein [Salinicoccus]MCD2138053.1 hypothetical protein [Salinicoccus halitifaciens]SOC41698.1 hypothetical protein SAMN05878391_1382 [Salinicoccus kekensis]